MRQMPRLITADEVIASGWEAAGGVIDLAEYVHPSARAAALERLAVRRGDGPPGPLAVILPSDAAPAELEQAARSEAAALVMNDAESAAQLGQAGALLDRFDATARLVPRMTSGTGVYVGRELAASHRRVTGLWYAVADLLIDFDDEPSMPYYFDAGESRLAAPAWTRSRLLTIARAAGINLWGQLDLGFADAPPEHECRRAVRLAELSGFDVLVTRHALAETVPAGRG